MVFYNQITNTFNISYWLKIYRFATLKDRKIIDADLKRQ